jgi:transposase
MSRRNKQGSKGNKKGKRSVKAKGFTTVHPNAAGIDIGSTEHWVAVPPDRCQEPVRGFSTFTEGLHELAKWLKACGIDTVAMESTGVYWIPVFQILEDYGFEVKLVNASHVQNVPGRKSDVRDCEWIRQLHTYGLLSGAFRPDWHICVLRAYMRQRETLIKYAANHVQHMQKALMQMNVQLHHVISDITGVTGMKIIRAILAGEHDAARLAELKDWRIKNSAETIANALTGDYRDEHLFALRQSVELYDYYREKIAEADRAILDEMKTFESKVGVEKQVPSDKSVTDGPSQVTKRKKNPRRNEPTFDCKSELYRIAGVDLTRINGISESTAQLIISEIGTDVTKWNSEREFSSWLGLCPEHAISGGKILRRRTRKVVNRVSNALRMCAQSLLNSKSALGAFARRIRARRGTPVALTATAHKLARMVYRTLRYGQEYVDMGQEKYEAAYNQAVLRGLEKKARELGYCITPLAAAAPVVP